MNVSIRNQKRACKFAAVTLLLMLCSLKNQAQGTWTALTNKAPDINGGEMLLLSDGTVLAKTFSGGSDGYGNLYDKLTPDIHGSYINGTWTKIANMKSTRLYYSSQVLKDGRVYVAGGEYGSGNSKGETYDPLSNVWTAAPNPGKTISDANSEILEDGRVLQALVTGSLKGTDYYDPVANTYSTGPTALGVHNESVWVKLPDNSILFVDANTTNSERYIPSTGTWLADATLPVSLYDPYGLETGAGFLLPDGRAFFLGSTGHTAYYTPSGSTTPGSWAAGPDIPGAKGTPDAPAAMMVNGKILCAVSPTPTSLNHFPTPTSFYEFDYSANTFTSISAPGGGTTKNVPSYVTGMLDLPDGSVLFGFQDSTQYYVYTPSGSALASGKPVINSIRKNDCASSTSSYTITGTLFNGISEGAAYGDDWQMASNYPIVRLTLGTKVYYARTYNWNSTGVQRGSNADTAQFTLPAGLSANTYSLVVVANGIASDAVSFVPVLKAIITPLGSLDICQTGSVALQANSGPGYTYQWKKGAQNIAGATNQTYTATTKGSYKVIVSNTSGCSKTSPVVQVTKSCKVSSDEIADNSGLSVYPNPNDGMFMVDFSMADESINAMATVQVINMIGQKIYEENIPVVNGRLQKEISFTNETDGVHFVKVLVNGEQFTSRVLISK